RAPGGGARGASPRSERQANAVPLRVERHVVHEVAHHEQPAPVLALEVLGTRGVRQLGAIETAPVVGDVNPHDLPAQFHADADDPGGVFAGAVADGVAEGFGERRAEVEIEAAGGEGSGGETGRHQVDGVADDAEIARDVEPHFERGDVQAQGHQNAASASSAVLVIANSVSSLVSSNSVCRSSFRPARRSSPPCSRIFLESETRTPSPDESMYPVLAKSTTNLRPPPSRASSTFCLSSWRLPTIS